MKLNEQVKFDSDGLIIKQTYTADPALSKANEMRQMGHGMTGEHRCVGVLPEGLMTQWAKEAGVDLTNFECGKAVTDRLST